MLLCSHSNTCKKHQRAAFPHQAILNRLHQSGSSTENDPLEIHKSELDNQLKANRETAREHYNQEQTGLG